MKHVFAEKLSLSKASLMTKRAHDFRVVNNIGLKKDFFVLELSSSEKLPEILPGQFTQVRVDGSPATFLRRPISFYDVDYEKNLVKLLIQTVGKGTEKLSLARKGDTLNMIYPLGNTFSLPEKNDSCLLIGGGVGIAPLYLLAKKISGMAKSVDILLGFRNSDRIIDASGFIKYGNLNISTEDGSEGQKGMVTDHSILATNSYSRIYCCGPEPMMKAIASLASASDIFCEVSLEHLMACGIGICLCCTVETTSGNLCTCVDGPVFNIKVLKW